MKKKEEKNICQQFIYISVCILCLKKNYIQNKDFYDRHLSKVMVLHFNKMKNTKFTWYSYVMQAFMPG